MPCGPVILVDRNPSSSLGQHYSVFTAGQSHAPCVVAAARWRLHSGTWKCGNVGKSNLHLWWDRTASLENTYWKLTRLGETTIRHGFRKNRNLICSYSESHRVNGSGGCNRLAGSYELHGDRLTFSQMQAR